MEREQEERKQNNAVRSHQVDKSKTIIIKWGTKYNGIPTERWLQNWLGKGKIKFSTTYIVGAAERMKWLIFEEEFLKKFLMQKSDDIYKDETYIVDKVLTPEERRERWKKN